MLSASFHLEVLALDEALFWRSNRIREDIEQMYSMCARTVVQRVLEIARYKQAKEATRGKIARSKVVEAYEQNLQMALGSEEISGKYVQIAMQATDILFVMLCVRKVIFYWRRS